MAVPGLSGARQILTISTTAGSDALLMLGMKGHERLGRLPQFDLDMVSNVNMLGQPEDIDLHALIGTRATVTLEIDSLTNMQRHWNGFIIRAERGEAHGRFVRHKAVMRPWPWFMTRRRNSRIFQSKTVKEILTAVFNEYSADFDMRLVIPVYPTLDYTVQYNETDFDFCSRLMERYGIYYFFEHTSTTHKMVLVDLNVTHLPKMIPIPVQWANSLKQAGAVDQWSVYEEVRTQKIAVADYDYLDSKTAIKAEKAASSPPAALGKMEDFEYPALVVQNSQKEEKATAMPPLDPPADAAKLLMEERSSMQAAFTGVTNQRDMAVGATFILKPPATIIHKLSDADVYLMVDAHYDLAFADHESVDELKQVAGRRTGFRCEFICISFTAGSFRPERITPRPTIAGPQTAVVTGSSGNEIETDKHGRVKVQFRWDREGKNDQNSSCWLRVAQPWAGKGFGMFTLPRVGHEVVVSFLEGDPDKPLVTGSVYNDQNTMAWKLPDFATCSGIVTMTTKSGAIGDYPTRTSNELRFEDKKDSEYIWVHAQKDFYRHVKGDAFDFIEKNETVRIKEQRKTSIGKDMYTYVGGEVQTEIVKDMHLTVGADTLVNIKNVTNVKIGKELAADVGKAMTVKVGDKFALKVSKDIAIGTDAGFDIKTAQNFVVDASGKISLKGSSMVVIDCSSGVKLVSGGSSITLGSGGVTIDGSTVKINCGGSGGAGESGKEASVKDPAEAKVFKDLSDAKYEDQFKDPMTKK